ncbi:hypothetical protein DYB28_005196, partial [Aphanomyces astaci]
SDVSEAADDAIAPNHEVYAARPKKTTKKVKKTKKGKKAAGKKKKPKKKNWKDDTYRGAEVVLKLSKSSAGAIVGASRSTPLCYLLCMTSRHILLSSARLDATGGPSRRSTALFPGPEH